MDTSGTISGHVREMSATDELRRLLDDRGVEWRVGDYPTTCTVWESDGIVWHGLWRDGCIELIAWQVTPEQAIDATLGRGTCRDLAETPDYRYKTQFECSECGYEYSSVGGFGCDYGDEPDFRYCPNCGKAVVECD